MKKEQYQEEVLANKSNGTVPWQENSSSIQVNPASSYASLVDPEEGTELKFVSAKIIDWKKIAKIDKEDVENEIEYWQNAVICSFLGANPPYQIMHGFIRCIWGAYEIDKILQFPDYIEFSNEEEVLIMQQVHYERKPIKYTYCKMFGHEEINCKKKGGIRTEWRPGSNTEQLSQTAEQHPSPSMEEFTQVAKRNAAKQTQHTANQTTYELENPFQALEISMNMGNKKENGGGDGGLNWPNKQEDLKAFLHTNKVGMIGLIETKIKMANDSFVAARAFSGWRWDNKSTPTIKGRIWIAWQTISYEVQVIQKSNQLIHSYVTQVTTNKKFYITFVYGMNHE
ncbi:hypothetical protein Cgig2_029814 [Carnegiea gigantea]|uniref:Uncharacterized protein n=1 Tax=Carnegiea gigantea TaxID=171969 RepID=A0A9Q1GUZ0_9CARY|nr:hypothetical protein Cgig2_029814 [Carnegiea gigantea]